MMCNIIVAAIFLLNYDYVECVTNPLTVTGGEHTEIKEHKFMVSIYSSGRRCGGSIITERLVITAAHYIYGINYSLITVHVGSSHPAEEGENKTISLTYTHKNYNDTTKENDISLLLIEGRFNFSDEIGAVALPTSEGFWFTVGTEINTLGFGKVLFGLGAWKLQEAKLKIENSTECKSGFGVLFESQFCAKNIHGKLSKEDEGDPVFDNNTLIGFVSLTEDEHNKDLSVIVEVTKYLEFIHFVMDKHP